MTERLDVLFQTVQKEPGRPNEDQHFEQRYRREFALSDGASTSFAGRAWAKSLCTNYERDKDVRLDWIRAARETFNLDVCPDPDDWAAAFAMEKGSYASFLGFELHKGPLGWDVIGICIGDTAIFAIDDAGNFYDPCNFSSYDFSSSPVLIGSDPVANAFLENDDSLESYKFSFPLPNNSRIVAVTDALAAWVVADGKNSAVRNIEFLISQATRKLQYQNFVERERSEGRLRRDDTSLLLIRA